MVTTKTNKYIKKYKQNFSYWVLPKTNKENEL